MRYYGGKSKLLEFLSAGVSKTGINHGSVFCDLFTGTTSVARYFKQKGYTVYANDFMEFSYSLARTYIQNNTYPPFMMGMRKDVPGSSGSSERIYESVNLSNNLKPEKRFIYRNCYSDGARSQ